MIVKPSVAKHKYTLDGATEGNTKQIATSTHEVVAILVTGGSADVVVGVYDTATGDINDKANAVFVGANQGESMPFCPAQGIPFLRGIFLDIEQGGVPFNGKVTLLYN